MSNALSRSYSVRGMTCEHCRSAVAKEVMGIHGVDAVEVDLDSSRLDVSGASFTDDQVAAAVAKAGYEVAPNAT